MRISAVFRKRSLQWAFFGGVLSLGAPIGEFVLYEAGLKYVFSFEQWAYIYSLNGTLLIFTFFGYISGRTMEHIEALSFRDSLTQLYNRRYIMQQLEDEIARNLRYNIPLSLILLDLDHFKKVNDQHGHMVGDQTLKVVSQTVRESCRVTDFVGRFGGEEFIIVCPNTTEFEAVQLADRIRKSVEQIPENLLGFKGIQTISLGVMEVMSQHGLSLNECLNLVDQALYLAKNNGRNRVEVTHYQKTD